MGKRFYLVDEKTTDLHGKEVVQNDVLYFEFDQRGNSFVGRANKDHTLNFAVEFHNFMEANPDFENPFSDSKDAKEGVVEANEVGQDGKEPKIIAEGSSSEDPAAKRPAKHKKVKA